MQYTHYANKCIMVKTAGRKTRKLGENTYIEGKQGEIEKVWEK